MLSGYMGHGTLKSAELYLRLVPGRFVRPLSSLQGLQKENAQVEAPIYVTPNRHLHPAGSRFRSPNVAKSPVSFVARLV